MSSYPVKLGLTLDRKVSRGEAIASGSSLVSIKYNFRPPSIEPSSPGYLYSTNKQNSQWSLEYDMREREEERRGSRSSAQGFQGSITSSKDVDCVLVWDEDSQSYLLEQIDSTLSFRYDRGHTRLSEKAREAFDKFPPGSASEAATSVRGASHISERATLRSDAANHQQQNESDGEMVAKDGGISDEATTFERNLESGLEGLTADEEDKDSSMEELDETNAVSPQRARTGLGLLEDSGLREDVLTPRGSPYIDRPKSQSQWDTTRSNLNHNKSNLATQVTSSMTRSTSVVSPTSNVNSPRTVGLDSALSVSSSWKPPAQRSNVAIAYDEDEEDEGEEESEEDEEEDDDDDEDDEEADGDLDDFARQLESSLQG
ncbi:hypothetical protein CBS101457_006289 [Exobasidium rhododendri]|nr:hypothetical protein CBS101457_006289 [Exobasidium rhododendri]